ncbi:MAG TPA: sulfatase-like hydrolase/transferase [Planctomycetes bacterium]|nr:sulfatase-like hydrolase/transferase [Planctomycetota bacterium]
MMCAIFVLTSCRKASTCRLSGAGKEKPPNIIVLTVDTLRADHMALYGYHRDTMPAIEKLAKSAVVFDQAVVSRGNTRASYASMLTSLHHFHHGVYNNNWVLHENFTTLPEVLKKAGYHTAGFVSNFVLVGNLSGCDQGFDVYDDRVEERELNRPNFERSAGGTLKAILEWLQNEPPQPFFLFTNFIDPHGPYTPPKRFRDLYKTHKVKTLNRKQITSYQYVEDSLNYYDYVDRYDAEIAYVDQVLGELIETLKSKNLWDNSLIIFLGDHGESLGEHNIFFEHQFNLFEETVRVPLLVRLPAVRDGTEPVTPKRVSSLGSPMDLMPTILDYLGITLKDKIDGRTLLPLLDGDKVTDRMMFHEFPDHCIPASNPDSYAVRTATHKLIRILTPKSGQTRAQVVFDIIADPLEQRPIRYDQSVELHRSLAKEMNTMLKQVAEYEIPYELTYYDVPLGKRTEYVEQRKKEGPKRNIKTLTDDQIERLRGLGYIK